MVAVVYIVVEGKASGLGYGWISKVYGFPVKGGGLISKL